MFERILKGALLAAALVSVAAVPVATAATPEDTIRESRTAFYYPGGDFKARVMMKLVGSTGQERVRELTMLRKNQGQPGGDQKYFIYFHQPADVKEMTFMVNKYSDKESDRWLFVPALNMVRRIAAKDKSSSFVGSDATYEDVSGRNAAEDDHEAVKEEKLGGSDCLVIKSTPKAGDMDYAYRLSWIDKKTKLPLKEEYYDRKNELYKVFTAEEVSDVKGFATVTKRLTKNLKTGHRTEVTFSKVDYNVGIDDSLFTERFLKQPPRKWIE